MPLSRTAFAASFDAFRITSLEVAESVVEDSRIALRWVWTAIHQGPYLDIPASGKEFKGWNVIFFDTRDGLITRDLSTWDCTQYLALNEIGERGPDG